MTGPLKLRRLQNQCCYVNITPLTVTLHFIDSQQSSSHINTKLLMIDSDIIPGGSNSTCYSHQ